MGKRRRNRSQIRTRSIKISNRHWIAAGAVSGFIAVAAGAFGAHGLKNKLSTDMLIVFETAARYQMYHAMALIAAGLVGQWSKCPAVGLAGWSFLWGTVMFSGSLYALSLTEIKWLGAITPLGGLGFMLGWLTLAWAAVKG